MLACMNIEENKRARLSEGDEDGDETDNRRSGTKPYRRMISSCVPEISPKARIMIFKITRIVVATGKLDMFMTIVLFDRYKCLFRFSN
jgi:hypothetical protein